MLLLSESRIFGIFLAWCLLTKACRYFCNARAEKYAAGGSFNVHFFLGDFNSDPLLRGHDSNLVGTFSVFANDPETTGCVKCQGDAQDGLIVTASIPLTGALLDRIPDLQTLDPDVVIPYLQKNLHWRCNRVCTLHVFN